MKMKLSVVMIVALSAILMATTWTFAAKSPDEVELKAPYEHEKGAVKFTHKKHAVDYKVGCGECHHDDKGQPLANLKDGDPVKKCFECHNKPGEIKGKKAKGLSDKEKLAYHANAMHDNCVGCHKKYNKEKNTKAAPTTCTNCHPKEAK